MSFESFIARKYFRSGTFFVSFSTLITIIGVTLGVAVVCFVMSMHNGFESEIRSRLLGTTSHISVFPYGGELIQDQEIIKEKLEAIDGVQAASAFVLFKAAVSSLSAGDGIVVRGINLEDENRTSNIGSSIVSGEYSFEPIADDQDSVPGILIGTDLASNLGVYLGDPIILYSLRGEDLKSRSKPKLGRFYVVGIFETGMFEFDGQLAYISLESAQKLFKTGEAVTTLHLKLDDIYMAEELAPVIDLALDHQFQIIPWNELHKNLFSWIEFEKEILFLGFILIVIVAAFSIISTLVMMTMEKRTEIGILKTMGSIPGQISRIFIYNGLLIGVIGVSLGWAIALTAAYVQNTYKLISLPPDIYFISFLPIDARPLDFGITGAATLAICFLAALYPARKAAGLSVIEVLRE